MIEVAELIWVRSYGLGLGLWVSNYEGCRWVRSYGL